MLQLLIDHVDTPIGKFWIVVDRDGNLRATYWDEQKSQMHRFLGIHYRDHGFQLEPGHNPNGLTDAISRYFAESSRSSIDSRGNCRYGFPTDGMARLARNSMWDNGLLRATCAKNWPPFGRSRRRSGQWIKSGWSHCALPPCDRIRWLAHWLRRRYRRKRWLLAHEGRLSSELFPQPTSTADK